MYIHKLSPIDWLSTMESLSVGAFYLLNVLYRWDMEINDSTLMACTGFGVSTHRHQKKELIDKNYLTIKQIGKGLYQYTLKDIRCQAN